MTREEAHSAGLIKIGETSDGKDINTESISWNQINMIIDCAVEEAVEKTIKTIKEKNKGFII